MKKLRIGVIGTGRMGERHARVYANLMHADLVGITDPNPERGREVASSYQTRFFDDIDNLLSKVDAVTIASPTDTHFELVQRCVSAGIAAMVEKPLAATVAEAEKLAQQVESAGAFVQVGHIERFNPAFTELMRVIADLDLIGISIRRLSPSDTSNVDADVIRDLMIHDLDLITAMAGCLPDKVSAVGRSLAGRSIDHAVASLSFKAGPIATLSASRVTQEKIRMIEVVADGAYIQADLLFKSVLIHRRTFGQYIETPDSSKYLQEALTERIHVPAAEPLMLELSDFVECVRDSRPPRVTVNDGLQALRLAEQIVASVALESSKDQATARIDSTV